MTYMSLVEKEYRGQGIYTKMLNLTLEKTKHFDEIDSFHHIYNNQVIATKLKRGFRIIGLDTCVTIGPKIKLRYFNNPELEELMRFRMGVQGDPRAR